MQTRSLLDCYRQLFFIVNLGCLLAASHNAYAQIDTRPWILVDVNAHSLSVIDEGAIRLHFDNISLGRGGPALLRERGDAKTPLGQFQVAWINADSRYHRFFGLDYPNLDYAQRAYSTKLINADDYSAIRAALLSNKPPPQDTRLGGYIGIHGIGNGDPKIHRSFNWTDGCVAVTNGEIDQLAQWISVGTKVVIQ